MPSGRQAEKPIAEEDLKILYRGLKKRLLAGDEQAQVEFLMRLDGLRLTNKISGKQHQDLVKSAAVRRMATTAVAAESRTKRAEAATKKLADAKAQRTDLRDVGQPPDGLAGEPAPCGSEASNRSSSSSNS